MPPWPIFCFVCTISIKFFLLSSIRSFIMNTRIRSTQFTPGTHSMLETVHWCCEEKVDWDHCWVSKVIKCKKGLYILINSVFFFCIRFSCSRSHTIDSSSSDLPRCGIVSKSFFWFFASSTCGNLFQRAGKYFTYDWFHWGSLLRTFFFRIILALLIGKNILCFQTYRSNCVTRSCNFAIVLVN